MSLPEEAKQLIRAGALGHLVTINPDGSPQVSCVWAKAGDDELETGHLFPQRKLENVRRDPRVTISFEGTKEHRRGMREYVVVHGRATIEEGGAPELLQELSANYIGPDVKFPPMDDPPPGVVVHIAVDRLGGVGPWA